MKKGGAERVISLLLKELEDKKNIRIHFIMMESGIDYDLPESINPIIFSTKPKSGLQKLLELPIIALRLNKYIKEHQIDSVISFLYRPNYVNIISKILGSNHMSIINIRSTTSRYKNEGLVGKVNLFLIKRLFNKADLIVSNSYGVDNDLKSLFDISTKTKVIYNPIDIEYINNKKNICEDMEFNFEKNKRYIISVGRLIPLKRNKDLLEAFFYLQKDDDNLELIFLGDGVLKEELIKECKKLEISQKVNFLGNVKNPFYYLNKSNLFVLNSEIEGFPNVLVEAMACGLLVISSDCKSGPKEILGNDEFGLLYPVGDIQLLVKKIKYYLYEIENSLDIKNKSIERLKEFNIERILNEYKEIITPKVSA